MGLSCDCDGDVDWYYCTPDDYTSLAASKRKRCCSCNILIDVGATTVKFDRWRHPNSEIEERIYDEGGEVELANWYMCEECGDLYFSIVELGFCIQLGEDKMKEVVKEYAEIYQPIHHLTVRRKQMKVWTNNRFSGFWEVGTAAVIIADTADDAAQLLSEELAKQGLKQKINSDDMESLNPETEKCRILADGNY